MKKNDIDTEKLKEQISKGLDLSFKKLVKQKQAENGTLIFSENGQIKEIKASDIKV
jgi:hypothetical protein